MKHSGVSCDGDVTDRYIYNAWGNTSDDLYKYMKHNPLGLIAGGKNRLAIGIVNGQRR